MPRDRSGSNRSGHKSTSSTGSTFGHRARKSSTATYNGEAVNPVRGTESIASASPSGPPRTRKVKTIPPFAKHDPPSPPTSPRVQPTSPTTAGHHVPGLSITSLEPTLTNSSLDPTRPQSPFGGSIDDDPTVPAHWWTFAIPGRYRGFQGIQSAWQEHVQANERLREESEHMGKDYFADKRRKSSGDVNAEGQRQTRRLSTIPAEDGDAYEMELQAFRNESNKEKRTRFNTLSLPGSRRASSDNINKHPSHERAFTLGPPIRASLLAGGKKLSFMSAGLGRAPNRSRSTPTSLHEDAIPPSIDEPILEGEPQSESPVDTVMPRTPQRPMLNIAIPPPIFASGPPGFGTRPPFQALSPPTPEAWDRASIDFSNTAQRGSGHVHPPSPWSQPYQSADYGFRHQSGENGATTWSGETLVNERDPSGQRDGKWQNRRTKMKGKAAQATGWSALRRKMVKEGPGGTFRQRTRRFLIFDARSALYLRLFGCACTVIALALSILNWRFEQALHTKGLVGLSPLLTIGYACVTIVHQFVAIWRESFGRPIGLWGLRSKMMWVCGDLLFIALWSSDLSLAISDYMSTPLLCTRSSPWWSAIPQFELPESVTQSREKDDVCDRQAALIAFVLLTAVMYVANMILSLFRIMERIRVVAKQYAKADAQQI